MINVLRNSHLAQVTKFAMILSRILQPKILLFIVACILISLPACQMQEYIEKTHKQVAAKYESTRPWADLPLRTISWNQAITLIENNNIELRKANTSIESAERKIRSVYTDLIPGVSFYGNMTNSLSELIDLGASKKLNSNINVSFYLPTLTQLPYRVYSAQARHYAAVKAKEGRKREFVAKLYQTIRKREVSDKNEKIKDKDPDKAEQTSRDELAEYNKDSQYWQEISSILGNRDARWQILPETIPYIEWRQYKKKLDTLDHLRLNLYAMKIEEARLRQYGVAINYLPTINASVYSPSLFSSTGGTYSGTFLDSDDTTINLSVSAQLDTKLDNWNSYKTNKENFNLICHEIVGELIAHRVKLRTLKQSIEEYERWKSYMKKKITHLCNEQVNTAADYNKKMEMIHRMEIEMLNQERSAITSEAALMLEYGFIEKK